jgi:transposase
MSTLALRLVSDELWELAEPLIPRYRPRRQGGGTSSVDDRAVVTAIVYVLTSGCAWRHLPGEFRVSSSTAHRRFLFWTREGLWPRLHQVVLDELGARVRSIGAARSWTPPRSALKGGRSDRTQSG